MSNSNSNKRARRGHPKRSYSIKRARSGHPKRSNSNNRACRGHPKRSSFADDLNSRTLPAAVNLLRKLDDVDFGNFESQLQPIADSMDINNNTLLKECMKFLVLKKIASDEDATTLSPTDVIDAVWHKLLLNTRLYKSINDALGGEMINHNPEGGRDVAARNERVHRAIEMYKSVFVTRAESTSLVWEGPAQPPPGTGTLISIRVETGQAIFIRVNKSTTVESLMQVVENRIGIHMKDQRLLFHGDSVWGSDLLDRYGFEEGDIIDLFIARSGC